MSWTADQIYTLPNPLIIDYFKGIPAFQKSLFLVNDLDGIRFDWEKDFIFSNEPSEKNHMRHGLPERGLLTVAPNFYRDEYDIREADNDDCGYNYGTSAYQWKAIDNNFEAIPDIPLTLGLDDNQIKLLGCLQWLHKQTKEPIMYYKCEMWGGEVDEELSIAFNNGIQFYWYDPEKRITFQLNREQATASEKTPLQCGLEKLGLFLPTFFFALHDRSFDWQRYQIR